MSAARAAILLISFVVLALCVVGLRLEQTRAAARAIRLELRQVEARRELWALQARMARLRSPERIRTRMELFEQLGMAESRKTGDGTASQ